MTNIETPTAAPKPVKKRKAARKRAQPKAVAAPKLLAAYAGIDPRNCPTACNEKGCIISGTGICAHPFKGGLQASLQSPEAMRRLNDAKRALGKQKLNIGADD